MDDLELITAARQGDLEAFSQLVLRHQVAVRACLTLRLDNPHDAEDLAQETFVLAFTKLVEFTPTYSFGAWLRGIAFNLLRNHQRRQRARPTRSLSDLQEVVDEAVEATCASTGEAERYLAIRQCLERLDHASRELVKSRYEDDVDVAELCRRLGKKHSTVTMHLHRIRLQLRNCMELRLKTL
jgi:RNA polymerase sigma-70 factor (ECF subfamily)